MEAYPAREQNELDRLQLDGDEALRAEYALYSQVADLYYNRGLKISEIAKKLSFSSAKVSRLLAAAREKGVVEIRVHRIINRLREIEKRLTDAFSLTEAIVISSFEGEGYEEELETVTDFASVYVSDLLKGKKTLGISNGNAVNKITGKLHRIHPCELDTVQIIGSGSNTYQDVESRELVTRISGIFPGGRSYFLNTPIFMEDRYAKERLLREPSVSAVFDRMRACDILLTGIGGFQQIPKVARRGAFREYLTEDMMAELAAKGAVGSVCAQYYDIRGTYLSCEWNEKCIGMPFEDIRENAMTIGVACGAYKQASVLGALRAGLINVLITDEALASGLLAIG